MVKLERIRAALPSAAAWRNETEPDTAERYARTAAKLAALLREVSDGDDDAGDRFALASALWKFSGDFHAGQFSGLYRVGCVISADPIRFRPGMSGAVSWEPFGPERHLYRHFRKVWNRSESRGVDLAERAAVVLCILCADETEGGDE